MRTGGLSCVSCCGRPDHRRHRGQSRLRKRRHGHRRSCLRVDTQASGPRCGSRMVHHARAVGEPDASVYEGRRPAVRPTTSRGSQHFTRHRPTLVHNTQSDYLDSGYSRAFSRLVADCHSIWLRDPDWSPKPDISARRTGRHGSARMPRFCWTPERSPGWSARGGATGSTVERSLASSSVSGRRHPRGWPDTARRSRPVWTFGPSGFFGQKRSAPQLPVDVRPGPTALGDLLAALSQYRFIITDTYHLCVNAWRVGTPTVCIAARNPVHRRVDPCR